MPDRIGYLGLGHVFTANMTGNTVLLGLHLAQEQGAAAVRSLIALLGFGVGLVIGALIVERSADRAPWPKAVTLALALEVVILAVFSVGSYATAVIREAWEGQALIASSLTALDDDWAVLADPEAEIEKVSRNDSDGHEAAHPPGSVHLMLALEYASYYSGL